MAMFFACFSSSVVFSGKNIMTCGKGDIEKHMLESIKNNSTLNTYIKLILFDEKNNREIKLVVENIDLSSYIMSMHNYTFNEYVHYYVENYNKAQHIDIGEFKKIINRRFNNQEFVEKYFNQMVYKNEATFNDLSVDTESQLLETYFNFNADSGEGVAKLNLNNSEAKLLYSSEVLALLISLGYQVYKGDVVPNIHIKRYCK